MKELSLTKLPKKNSILPFMITPLLLVIFCFFSCKKSDNYTKTRKILEKVLIEDQKYRGAIENASLQKDIDEHNLRIVTKIIDSLGWLGKDKIGEDANLALFATIQHSNLKIMEKYLPVLKDAVNKGNATKKELAFLIDRVERLNGRKQIYGTQYFINDNGNVILRSVIDSVNINKRRKSMNMEPIEDYLKLIDSIRHVDGY